MLRGSEPSRPHRLFGPPPACPCSVCVLAQSAAFRSVLVLIINNNNNNRTKARSPGPALSSSPRSGRRFRGDACALSRRSWLLEPRLVRVAEAAAPPLLACLCVGPGDGGAEGPRKHAARSAPVLMISQRV
ncbi:hypothetical protein D9C73_021408 [Collichthys lucidus]|uniref:Uncharacterized protein n=1 Tax=Collichthys lucidus TaxID=240159 RepID=A0A4U5VGB7_COLLU|nr:hypothetical protein D9C73_021408 [Collichthys lucidus]